MLEFEREISQRRSDARIRFAYPSATAHSHRSFDIRIRLIVIEKRVSSIWIAVLLIPNRPTTLIACTVSSAFLSCARRLGALLRTVIGYLSTQHFPTVAVPARPCSRRALCRTRLVGILLRSRTRLVTF